ncbi:MAG: hypothetical protein IT337_15900 [Thermomicrobiales bacterium]|nr:hypothetical protein [Thermomicrobiales bacterium]
MMAPALGVANNLQNMVSVIREVSLDELREAALERPRFVVFGPTAFDAGWFADTVLGPGGAAEATTRPLTGPVDDLDHFDAAIIFDPEDVAESSGLSERLRALPLAPPVFRQSGHAAHEAARIDALRAQIVRRMPERAPALGRAYPALRAVAAKVVIDETSVVNAQFALMSNIPSLLPFIGGLAAIGADFIVLTKNQVMMVYKLAAIYGRDLEDQIGILQEILPVVGVGFGWRTVARGAVTLLPFAAGTLPKVGIAYAGTAVVGRGAEFYYRTNRRPSRAQLEQYARQAQDAAQRVAERLSRRKRTGGDGGDDERGDAGGEIAMPGV